MCIALVLLDIDQRQITFLGGQVDITGVWINGLKETFKLPWFFFPDFLRSVGNIFVLNLRNNLFIRKPNDNTREFSSPARCETMITYFSFLEIEIQTPKILLRGGKKHSHEKALRWHLHVIFTNEIRTNHRPKQIFFPPHAHHGENFFFSFSPKRIFLLHWCERILLSQEKSDFFLFFFFVTLFRINERDLLKMIFYESHERKIYLLFSIKESFFFICRERDKSLLREKSIRISILIFFTEY